MDLVFVFIIGAIIGSFLNVCIYRMPRGQSIVFPASHCPHCKRDLLWYDNIPILSYFLLMGRCGFCRKRISMRYPLVEALTAVIILFCYRAFGIQAKFFMYSALVSALIVVTFIDFDYNEIPDEISIGGLVAGLIAALAFPSIFDTNLRLIALKDSVLGALAGGGAIYIMGVVGKSIFRKEAMGGGDVKLMAMVGSILGWKLALLTFFVAPFFGAVVGLFLRIADGRETIPYGPYLSLAATIAVFFGNDIMRRLFAGVF